MYKAKDSYSMWNGDILLEKRKYLQKTQTNMARDLGISHRMYCYYESGEQEIPRSIELSVRYMQNSKGDDVVMPTGVLSNFDKQRIGRLCDALNGVEGTDANIDKILRQSKSELEYMLSKFE